MAATRRKHILFNELQFPEALIPDEFKCSISFTIMDEPIRLPDTNTVCDKAAIIQWLDVKPENPFNRQPMTIDQATREHQLERRITRYVDLMIKGIMSKGFAKQLSYSDYETIHLAAIKQLAPSTFDRFLAAAAASVSGSFRLLANLVTAPLAIAYNNAFKYFLVAAATTAIDAIDAFDGLLLTAYSSNFGSFCLTKAATAAGLVVTACNSLQRFCATAADATVSSLFRFLEAATAGFATTHFSAASDSSEANSKLRKLQLGMLRLDGTYRAHSSLRKTPGRLVDADSMEINADSMETDANSFMERGKEREEYEYRLTL